LAWDGGHGKTYLAVSHGRAAINAKKVSRIVLVRPAGRGRRAAGLFARQLAGEGGPYLRPLYDVSTDLLEPEKVDKKCWSAQRHRDRAPGLHARRTLNDAFIIMDEAAEHHPSSR